MRQIRWNWVVHFYQSDILFRLARVCNNEYWLPILAMDSKHMILSITSITFFWRSGDWKKWHSLIHFITIGKCYPNLYTTWSISNSIQILHLKKRWKVACNFKGGQILISWLDWVPYPIDHYLKDKMPSMKLLKFTKLHARMYKRTCI